MKIKINRQWLLLITITTVLTGGISYSNAARIVFQGGGGQVQPVFVSSGFPICGCSSGYIWSPATGFQALTTLPSTSNPQAEAISSDGQTIVGLCVDINSGYYRACIWGTNLQPIDLGFNGVATCVSANGNAVGGWEYNPEIAFRWTSNTFETFLGFNSYLSRCNGISADGSVVVGTRYGPSPTGVAVEWKNNQTYILGPTNGMSWETNLNWEAQSTSANGNAVAVGAYGNVDIPTNEVFLWTSAGGLLNITPPGSSVYIASSSMTADGKIIVGQIDGGPMIWTASSGMTNLNGYLHTNIFSASGLLLAISPDGRWTVAGTGNYTDIIDLFTPTGTNSIPDALAAATGCSNLVWSTSNDSTNSPWAYQSYITHDGVAALESGHSGNQSVLQATVTGPGTLNFWWRVSSAANSSNFTFSVSGVTKQVISGGDSGWLQESFVIPARTQTLTWVYTNGIGGGIDSGWVDDVHFAQNIPPIILDAVPENADLRLYWQGQGGSNYVVQAATNLTANNPFSDISPIITLSGSGIVTTNYLDGGALTNLPARFYRIRSN